MKAALLLILVLVAMRFGSWLIGWAMARVFCSRGKLVRAGANALCLAFLVGFLRYDHLPGEVLDTSALVFGVVTFAVFTALDFWKWPWSAKRRPSSDHPVGH